ncbi:hypothetical protein ACSQ76_11485 [Roseovarius sp. B08]|uniref:hypothetical protein n=1 Tax=Roseovarius sp. B08 TaxID=3449223 RepID=UPI003EDBAB29
MMFNYDPGMQAGEIASQGYAHLKGVLTDDFRSYLQTFLAAAMTEASNESDDWKIKGKKRQFVFDFPSDEAAEEFRKGMARLTGIAEDDFTVSERHLKVYDDAANPYPAPHKDRSASYFSIGLPVRIPEGSTVCVFPSLDPGPNTEPKAVFLEEGDSEKIRALYDSPEARMLNESLGDVVVFLGSSLYHERVKAAGTAVLYIKVNGDRSDPLGENIYASMAVTE